MKKTIENNILLAEFLGVKQKENNWFDGYELQKAGLPFDYGAMGNGTSNLKFHNSWDWLMGVVDKIENLENVFAFCIRFDKYTKQTRVEIHPYRNSFIKVDVYKKSKIEATYNACIKFVKWHNENK